MKHIDHRIYLELNSSGYRGLEIDEILPHFITDRKTVVGLTWESSAEEPESFTLVIIILIVLSSLGKGFLSELSKDLYQWANAKVYR
jgi:hypothetical protein